MHTVLFALAAPFALQAAAQAPAASASPDAPAPITSFDQMPIEAAGAARCGIAFAVIQGMQQADEPRALEYPAMDDNGGREYFVRAMARLMDDYDLSREQLAQLAASEVEAHKADMGARALEMMPACLVLKQAAGL